MLMPMHELVCQYNFQQVREILHVGAHLGEEAEEYGLLGVAVWWVEGNPDVIPKLSQHVRQYPNQRVVQALVTDMDGEYRDFNITNYDGMSSSIYPFGDHPKYSPDTVYVDRKVLPTRTIDSLAKQYGMQPDFLNLDLQGAELLALQGATATLSTVKFLYTEVSTGPVYLGGALMHDLDEFLAPDFVRVETDLGMHGGTHGDALYLRERSHAL